MSLSAEKNINPNFIAHPDVPEGSFIVRAHTPMSNLFSCLWFNEVERFTPRDQLSFAYTYLKLARTNPTTTFKLNMFKVCDVPSIVHRKFFSTIFTLSGSRVWLGYNTFGWYTFQESTFFIPLALGLMSLAGLKVLSLSQMQTSWNV